MKLYDLKHNLRVEYLANNTQLVPALKDWFEMEWSSHYGLAGPGDAQKDLLSYTHCDELPIGLVAFLGNELCGFAALKAESITTHLHLKPWIAAGIVHPDLRRKGIGTFLLVSAERIARELGYETLFCGTSGASRLLERRNWELIDRVWYNCEDLSIFQKSLR